jgi:glycine/D-amino acid oxidase-like deaminating enzyme
VKVDYIIVGLGLAGLSFAEQLLAANKSFVVFEDNSQTSSLVAGGVYNPVILKRFTPVWNAKSQLDIAMPFYEALEKKFNQHFDDKFSTRKVFKSIEDQNNWFIASDKPKLTEFMNPEIINEQVEGVIAEYGFGEVYQTGRVNTPELVAAYRNYLVAEKNIRFEQFDHSAIEFTSTGVTYKEFEATRIVFCEGFGLKSNPFFNELPLNGTKGETITIHAPELKIDFLIKSSVFVLPLANDLYKIGATFNWTDKTSNPTEGGRAELIEKLDKVLSVPYTIVDQNAGVRPTVKDRRPLVGVHEEHPQLAVLNGMGTRGVMIAPSMAKELYEHLEHEAILDPEVDIKRYAKSPTQ